MKKKLYTPNSREEYKEYASKLSKEEKEFIQKFYEDYYSGGVYSEDTILETEEVKKEARRNHNTLTRDVMDVAEKQGGTLPLDENTKDFMEYVSDENDWEFVYSQQGFKAASELIYEQAINDLSNSKLTVKVTLTRFFEKMLNLKRYNWRDRKHKREK
jgi:hypothetical protein